MQSQTHFAYLKKAHEITRSLESKTNKNRSRQNQSKSKVTNMPSNLTLKEMELLP